MRHVFLAGLIGFCGVSAGFAAPTCHVIESSQPYNWERLCVSSTLAPQSGNSYGVDKLRDGNLNTAWCEAEPGMGRDTAMAIEWDGPAPIRGIRIINGYTKSVDIWKKNMRARDITITLWPEGAAADQFLRFYHTLTDSMDAQYIPLGPPYERPGKMLIKIESAYPGSKWDDLCLTEIETDFGM